MPRETCNSSQNYIDKHFLDKVACRIVWGFKVTDVVLSLSRLKKHERPHMLLLRGRNVTSDVFFGCEYIHVHTTPFYQVWTHRRLLPLHYIKCNPTTLEVQHRCTTFHLSFSVKCHHLELRDVKGRTPVQTCHGEPWLHILGKTVYFAEHRRVMGAFLTRMLGSEVAKITLTTNRPWYSKTLQVVSGSGNTSQRDKLKFLQHLSYTVPRTLSEQYFMILFNVCQYMTAVERKKYVESNSVEVMHLVAIGLLSSRYRSTPLGRFVMTVGNAKLLQ